jgi:hypothetical protein
MMTHHGTHREITQQIGGAVRILIGIALCAGELAAANWMHLLR